MAPKSVITAVRELNEIARLAAGTLLGRSGAETMFEQRLAEAPPENFSGVPGRRGRSVGAALTRLRNALGDDLPCVDRNAGAMQLLQAAFHLDVRDENPNVARTYQAGAYLQKRLRTVAQFEGMMRHAVGDPSRGRGSGQGAFPDGFGTGDGRMAGPDDFTDPILPPDTGMFPPGPLPDPDGPGGLDPGPCDDMGDLCMTLFQEAAAALLSDPYIDLIDSVEPNCLCHDYDPNQVFVAHPKPGRQFPASIPSDIRLIFRGTDISANIIALAPDELRFRIPPNSHTGFVYLRGLFPVERGVGSRNLERLCGISMPDFPAGAQQGPAALISIIYPPVIDLFSANGSPGPEVEAEACSPVDICWHAHLSDQPPHLLIPPCGRIALVLRDEGGDVVAEGGPQGCFTVRGADDHTYTADVRSFAGDQECGAADPITIAVRRAARVHLVRSVPQESEILAGNDGSFFVDISCPAPADGLEVQLTSSDDGALQVPESVIIPAGQTRAPVAFTTADDTCGRVEVRAQAAGHMETRLHYDLVRAPALDWAITTYMPSAPPHTPAFSQFLFSVSVDCVPQPESRFSWKLVRIDAGGNGEELPATARRPSFGNFFLVAPTADAVTGLVLGTWAIVAEIPDLGLVSNALAFEVDICEIDITLDSITVTEGQGLFEGDLELHLTAIVRRDPRPIPGLFTPPHDFLRWPPFPAQSVGIGENETIRPQARIATYRVGRDDPIAADIEVTVREDDAFLQFGSDVGTDAGRLVVSCEQENVLELPVTLIGGVFEITEIGGGHQCDPPADFCASATFGSGPTGRVALVFKATPRLGP